MFGLGKGRRRGAIATAVAGATALALTAVGLTTGSVSAAPPQLSEERAKTISNDLVEIEPAKVRGTWTDPDTGRTGRIVAKFMPTEFVENDDGIAVEGVLTGVFTGKLPKDQQRQFSEPFTMEVLSGSTPGDATSAAFQTAAFAPASSHGCDILNLDLGPLDLNLLGLQIDLAPVVLDIVAQPGAGALLGNLLCAVAGLLDGVGGGGLGGLLDGVIDALNGLLGGLLDLQTITDLIAQIGAVLDDLVGTVGATQTV